MRSDLATAVIEAIELGAPEVSNSYGGADETYRDDYGVYAYTAPMFGDFMRRRHERLEDDQ